MSDRYHRADNFQQDIRDELEHITEPQVGQLTYDSYLKVRELLTLQQPLSSPEHQDEMLFIIIHQVYELWFKQLMHEAKFCAEKLAHNEILPFLRSLQRMTTIQDVLVKQIDILETMTPNDFNKFRDHLNPASGFQSVQFRKFEFLLGLKEPAYLRFFKSNPKVQAELAADLPTPSLYDLFLAYLSRRGFEVPEKVLQRDYSLPHEPNEDLVSMFRGVYSEPDKDYALYMALEALVDLDEKLLLWRFRHVTMVERIIGGRTGTGGSSGADYLSKTLSKRAFPELWDCRTQMSGSKYGSPAR